MSKELFRSIESLTPAQAIDVLKDFLKASKESDEKTTKALNRLKTFVEEVKTIDGLDLFLKNEIPFRLKEIHNVPHPSKELIDLINYDGLDEIENYLDNEYMDNVIKEQMRVRYDDLKESLKDDDYDDTSEFNERQRELKELEVALKLNNK